MSTGVVPLPQISLTHSLTHSHSHTSLKHLTRSFPHSRMVHSPTHTLTHLNAKGKIISNVIQVVLQQINHSLIEGIVLTLHISIVYRFPQNVFVERPREITVEKLVVVDSLGDHPADETKVVEVVWVHVGTGVGHVGDPVAGGGGEECVVGVEHVPSDDDVKLSQ